MKYPRVMCLVRGDETDSAAISTAIGLASGNNRSIRFVYVILVDRRFALDSPEPDAYVEAERVLRQAEHMSGHRTLTGGSILQSRSAGPVLVREALDYSSDVIVAAVKIIATPSSKAIDEVSEYLMANAPCAVVLVRDALLRYETIPDHLDLQVASGDALRS